MKNWKPKKWDEVWYVVINYCGGLGVVLTVFVDDKADKQLLHHGLIKKTKKEAMARLIDIKLFLRK